jgi:Tol biopolymer transport system component
MRISQNTIAFAWVTAAAWAMPALAVNDAFPMSYTVEPAAISDTANGDSTTEYGGDDSRRHISNGGRFSVFTSKAHDLIPGHSGPQNTSNVFLYDGQTGSITLVSHAFGMVTTGGNGDSLRPVLSGDGRRVAYHSSSTNLIAGYSGFATSNVYLYDVTTGQTSLISHAVGSNTTGGGGRSGSPVFSSDGSRLAFGSDSRNLVVGFSGNSSNIYLYDVARETTTLISHAAGSATTGGNEDSHSYVINADGRLVAYTSDSTNLVAGYSGEGFSNAYVFNAATGATTLVSHAIGTPTQSGNGHSGNPVLTPDGRQLVYGSGARNLVGGFTGNPNSNVYLHNVATGVTALLSHVAGNPSQGGNGNSGSAAISSNGRRVVYVSSATDLVSGFSGFRNDNVYLLDLPTGATSLVSRRADARTHGGNGQGSQPSITADGALVLYRNTSTDLIPNFSGGGWPNLYLFDVANALTTLVSHAAVGPTTTGNLDSSEAVISRDGTRVLYRSTSTDLEENTQDNNGRSDAVLYSVEDTINRYISRIDPSAPPRTGTGGSRVGPGRDVSRRQISADGRYAIFSSEASLVPSQSSTPGVRNIYLFDVLSGGLTLVSHAAGAPQTGGDRNSGGAVLSADGRRVAYASAATNLVSGLSGEIGDAFRFHIFLYDVATGETTLVSHAAEAVNVRANLGADDFALSADGGHVAFTSASTNLVSGFSAPTSGPRHVYLYDVGTRVTKLVSHAAGAPTTAGNNDSVHPMISADGTRVAYQSRATTLVSGFSGPTGIWNIYVYSAASDETSLVSHGTGQITASGSSHSSEAVISADGSCIAYTSSAENLVSDFSSNGQSNIFVFQVGTELNSLVSRAARSPTRAGNGQSEEPVVSADCHRIAYTSFATNLISGFSGVAGNVYLHDVPAGVTALVSHVAGAPRQGTGAADEASISADGGRVSFSSVRDVYLFDVAASATTLVSHAAGFATTGGNSLSGDSELSADGSSLVFNSFSSDLSTLSDLNQSEDAFYYSLNPRHDFGDAPDTYGTSLVVNGARHGVGMLRLGSLADAEGDGLPTAMASGDDASAPDDEDGVTIGTMIKGATNEFQIATSIPGLLSAWVDLRADGTFDEADRVLDEYITAGGSEAIGIAIPANSTTGTTFARFRLCAGVGECNTPRGPASTGEVEDYAVALIAAPVVELTPRAIAFSAEIVFVSSVARSVVVSNTGTARLNVGTPSVVGPDAPDFAISANTCTAGISRNASCRIDVQFRPRAAGERSATLRIPSNAPTSPDVVPLSGIGIKRATSMTALAAYSVQPLKGQVTFNPRATLMDSLSAAPIAGRSILFQAGGSPLCAGVTDSSGTARCQATLVGHVQEILARGYTAGFAGDSVYQGITVTAPLVCVGTVCVP